MTDRVQRTLAFLKEQFEGVGYFQKNPSDKAYRLEHSIRVANIAAQIARAEGMDEEAMTVACLLHDVGYGTDFPEGYDWKNHGRDGARIARPFLETLGLTEDAVNDICYAIAIHVDDKADFEGRRCPFTETVGDADNIDRFDTYRIYEAVRNQNFGELELAGRLEWLRQRLTQLKRLAGLEFGTPTATAMWRDKVNFQIQFFERLLAQTELSCLPKEMEE